mmetsp:Transcript_9938/g.15102  ORF Transcript_9938/g.15102 Transcript_9938/m.15102 type:complete len:470 (+) Transcript_9938:83-1492(+)
MTKSSFYIIFFALNFEKNAAHKWCKYKVYVYELSNTSLCDYSDTLSSGKDERRSLRKMNELISAFGPVDPVMPNCMRRSNQGSAARMTEYQLKHSSCRTFNAAQADLFFIPMFTAVKGNKEWRNICRIDEQEILKNLKFLKPSTACRHFLFFAKTFRACSTGKFWYDPNDLRLWQMARLAYDMPLDLPWETDLSLKEIPFKENYRNAKSGLIDRGKGFYGSERIKIRNNKTIIAPPTTSRTETYMVPFPNIYSVPYPSSIHWSSSNIDPIALRFPYKNRTTLINFIGTVGKRESSKLRHRMHHVLAQFNCSNIYCHHSGVSHGSTLLTKGNSIFCLEPGGDSPSRKSISDSIAFGCIPVTFGYATAQQYSDFWNSDMRVDISIRDMMHGPDTFLLDYLKAIANNKTLLTSKRRALDKVKKRFTYSTFADHNDAVDIILDLVHRHASHLDCASSWRKSPSTFFSSPRLSR